jgi:hypothetical protein
MDIISTLLVWVRVHSTHIMLVFSAINVFDCIVRKDIKWMCYWIGSTTIFWSVLMPK